MQQSNKFLAIQSTRLKGKRDGDWQQENNAAVWRTIAWMNGAKKHWQIAITREAVAATVSRCNRPQLLSRNLETIFLWVKLNAYARFILNANQSILTTLKKQTIHGQRFLTRQAAQQHIFEYIECYYNRVRWHPTNG